MNTRTAFEHALVRAFGDWFSAENPIPRCKQCHCFHEEPQRVLMALTGWPCDRVAKYHQEVFDRALSQSRFSIKQKVFHRLAPHWRKGGWRMEETDAEYYQRMLDLKANPPDWDGLLHLQAGGEANAKPLTKRSVARVRRRNRSTAIGAEQEAHRRSIKTV